MSTSPHVLRERITRYHEQSRPKLERCYNCGDRMSRSSDEACELHNGQWVCSSNCWQEYADKFDESLGSCGCIDYHMADCPTVSGYGEVWFSDEDAEADFWRED